MKWPIARVFLGITDPPMQGPEVLFIQQRLRELGLYED